MPEVEIPQPDEMHEKAEKPFTRAVALMVAVYACGLAVATFGGHNAAKEMSLAKMDESNQWNRYQSKSTRAALYKLEANRLQVEREVAGQAFHPAKAVLLQKMAEDEARMKADMKAIMDGGPDSDGETLVGAKHYQREVKVLMRKDPYFDFAEVGFQLAIVLASVAMLSGKRWPVAVSLLLAVGAGFLTANGFLLFAAVPGFEGGH